MRARRWLVATGHELLRVPLRRLPFLLPWLRLELLVRSITSTMWDAQAWPVVRAELGPALRMRAAVRREGWWN